MADDTPPRIDSRVRTEQDLRNQLRTAVARNAVLERALRVATDYADGPRKPADLRRLKTVLLSAGFPGAKPTAEQEADEPETS